MTHTESGVQPGDPLAGLRVLNEPQPVPDPFADVELVVEDARAALTVAVDRARPPALAGGAADAFLVELLGDRAWRQPLGVVAEDPFDDRGLRRVDAAIAADRLPTVADCPDDVVAVAVAAGRLSLLDPAAQAAPRLVRQVPQIKRTHGALEPDVELVHLALGQRHDWNAQEPHALVEVRDVLLVARDAVERLGHDDVELAGGGVLQELLDVGARADFD